MSSRPDAVHLDTQDCTRSQYGFAACLLMKLRRERLDVSDDREPGTLWNVVVLGILLSLLPTFELALTSFNHFVVGTLSLSMGLVFSSLSRWTGSLPPPRASAVTLSNAAWKT